VRRIGLIGWGAIGRSIIELWPFSPTQSTRLIGVCVRTSQLQEARTTVLPSDAVVVDSVVDLLALKPDHVIEAAGHAAVVSHGEEILRSGCSLYLLSVGSLAHEELRTRLIAAAEAGKSRILIPAGALAGFDGLLTMNRDQLSSVKYTSVKPVRAWHGTPAARAYPLEQLTQRTVIFSGNAGEAARLFPKNANLAAAVALAGIGFDRTEVELVADPFVDGNQGTVQAVSRSSTLTLTMSSQPSTNPKTSMSVGASVVAALDNETRTIGFV
jgi:aspartate dehydrogenase